MIMKTRILLLTTAFTMATFLGAQTPQDEKGDKDKSKAVMTGCLTKGSAGEYTLTDETGKKVTVMGSADLEKHSANHRVSLHGSQKMENGQSTFQVEKVEHLANTCSASPTR